ncbi:unnamed protein product [Arabidopsis thaliana]|uniref:Hexosyltransferase n=1 Tax=Arabidopsis thaliana TaxID=3702 RepID=A0A7G2EK49_ARATH|nr:unnamed protein product [Arabidopsis thaliana]
MRSITISSSNEFIDLMKIKVAARHISYRTLFHTILILAFLLPFVFILTAVVTLEGVNKCSSFDCFGRRLGPRLLGRIDDSERLVRDFYKILNEVSTQEIPDGLKLPESFSQLVSDMKNNHYDAKTFALVFRAMVEKFERDLRESKFAELMNKHFAASSIPKGIHCLSLRLTDEYSSNAHARRQLPSPELLPVLSDNAYHHFVLATDNILAASVVVSSAVQSSSKPEKIVFHVITDKKTYAVLEAVESHNSIRNYYHGNHIAGANLSETTPRTFASKLQSRSPKYISLLNHLRIYLPELFPNLDKVVFLDDDIVIQKDLSPLWDIDLNGKVNGAVETCRGEDNLKSNLTMWKLGTLPPALIAFKGHVQPIDSSWHMLGLGYQSKTNLENAKKAAVIHYNGQSKPWLEIANRKLAYNLEADWGFCGFCRFTRNLAGP